MAKFICLLAIVACANAGIVKRGFVDAFVGAISDVGSTFLPEETMRAGCAAVGLYNREKNGGPPIRDASGGIAGTAGSGLARVGNTVFSRSGMEQGCINAGFYDPNLDAQGYPKNQRGGWGNQGQWGNQGGQGQWGNQGGQGQWGNQGGQGQWGNQGGQGQWGNQGGQGQAGLGGGQDTTNIYIQQPQPKPQPQQQTVKTMKCIKNGVQIPCDAAILAQANGK